jgi:GNAT superfamily N-acetyltransferase
MVVAATLPGMQTEPQIDIASLASLKPADWPLEAIDDIFFTSSNTRTFVDQAARSAFRERWLGRYLSSDADKAHVAFEPSGKPVGYVVGAHDDPGASARFADIGYFATIAPLTGRYPAHLHINLAPDWRSRGIGARLIETFNAQAAAAGCPGVHVVTGFGVRNVGFYLREGFREIARFDWQGSPLVMLGKDLR